MIGNDYVDKYTIVGDERTLDGVKSTELPWSSKHGLALTMGKGLHISTTPGSPTGLRTGATESDKQEVKVRRRSQQQINSPAA